MAEIDYLKRIFIDLINGDIKTSVFSAYALLNLFIHSLQVLRKLKTKVDEVRSRRANLRDKDSMPCAVAVVYELLSLTTCSFVPVIGKKTLKDNSLGS